MAYMHDHTMNIVASAVYLVGEVVYRLYSIRHLRRLKSWYVVLHEQWVPRHNVESEDEGWSINRNVESEDEGWSINRNIPTRGVIISL